MSTPMSRAARAQALDQRSLVYLRTHLHHPVPERMMRSLGLLAGHGVIWIGIGSALAAYDARRRRKWLVAAALAPATILANYPLKRRIARRRPELDLERLGSAPNEHSFPSSHAASSFAAATAMAAIEPSYAAPLLLLATLISVGRPYLGMHYPSDVLGGAGLGIPVGCVAGLLLRRGSQETSQ
jgi:membrane-associated phospholipid phosphatase